MNGYPDGCTQADHDAAYGSRRPRRPKVEAIAERFQVPRVDVVDAVLHRLHTRVQGLEASYTTRHVDGFGRPALSVIERRPPGTERGRSGSERKGAA